MLRARAHPQASQSSPQVGCFVTVLTIGVLTIGMMLSHLGWPEEEARLTAIVREAVETGNCTRDVGGTLGTREVGEWIVKKI